jgi:hypothetical protein
MVGQDKAGDNRHRADGGGQPSVGIRHCGQKFLGLCCANSVLHKQRQQRFGRCPIRLGEVDVKGHDRCTGFAQPVDELGDDAARPGPLAELVEALVVDIDDTDRRVPRLARCRLWVTIEAEQREPLEQVGSGDSGAERDHQERQRQ